jgi:hypothetical protein
MTIYNKELTWEYSQFSILDSRELDEDIWVDVPEGQDYDVSPHGVHIGVEDSNIFEVQAAIYVNEPVNTDLDVFVQHAIQVPSGVIEFSAPTYDADFLLPIASSQALVTVYRVENLKWIIQIQETEPTA